MYGQIYKITNLINQKIYVGQTTKSLIQRFNGHVIFAEGGANTKLACAIRKYGSENSTIEKIDEAHTKASLNEKEIYWISKLNSLELGYNMTPGGEGGDTYCKRTPEQMIITKQKLYEYWKFHNPNHGQLIGPKNGMYGKKHTEEFKKKVSEKLKGRKKPDSHGKKISEYQKGRPKNYYPACKYLYLIDIITREEIKKQVRDITKEFNISSTDLKKLVESELLLTDRYSVKCVSTICDECSRVGSEISTDSKRGAIE